MSYTHRVNYSYNDGGTVVSFEDTQTASREDNISESIGATAAAKTVAFALDVSACKALLIKADQNLTIKTNTSTTGTDTIKVGPSVNDTYGIFAWSYGIGLATGDINAGLAGDIVVLYVTNDAGTAGTLTIKSLSDATP